MRPLAVVNNNAMPQHQGGSSRSLDRGIPEECCVAKVCPTFAVGIGAGARVPRSWVVWIPGVVEHCDSNDVIARDRTRTWASKRTPLTAVAQDAVAVAAVWQRQCRVYPVSRTAKCKSRIATPYRKWSSVEYGVDGWHNRDRPVERVCVRVDRDLSDGARFARCDGFAVRTQPIDFCRNGCRVLNNRCGPQRAEVTVFLPEVVSVEKLDR